MFFCLLEASTLRLASELRYTSEGPSWFFHQGFFPPFFLPKMFVQQKKHGLEIWDPKLLRKGRDTLQGTNISHLGKRKIIFKSDFWWDMLIPRKFFFLEHACFWEVRKEKGWMLRCYMINMMVCHVLSSSRDYQKCNMTNIMYIMLTVTNAKWNMSTLFSGWSKLFLQAKNDVSNKTGYAPILLFT